MNSPDYSPSNLIIAIVQSQDAESACHELANINTLAYQLPSNGGFLGQKNTTLLIRCANQIWGKIIQTLELTCKQRIENLPVNMGEAMMAGSPFTSVVTVGGAVIFSIEIEHYEEI